MLQYLGKTSCLRKAELGVQGILALVTRCFGNKIASYFESLHLAVSK